MRAVRNALFLGSVLSLAACGGNELDSRAQDELGQNLAPLHQAAPGMGIQGDYIVKVKEGATAQDVLARVGVSPGHMYDPSVLNGFSVTLNEAQLLQLRQTPGVEFVEEDQFALQSATQSNATWGLDRIDQTSNTLNKTYTYNTTAANVHAYIIDTGIQSNHPDFGGRASIGYDATGGNGQDCNGHGTHVAGTVGGTTYGVAKAVRLYGVRVLGCDGSGSNSGVIAGINWVRTNHKKPAVANMSLGGGYSSTINTAVTSLANAGVFVAVAAGNDNGNACNYSPASAPIVTTVGATTSTTARASYSNYGSCVDIYAPGSSITSAWIGSRTSSISGTSMASPHVAGVAALYKATYGDASQATIDTWLKNNATNNVVTGNPSGTVNKLLNKKTL
ncbi:S8 family peptidase [Archangium primigenium]|uniref:S8 family peptidase n=1 Tax=[Archangium] primigenium TaxID=2792470 RepID=UPI00195DF0B3|nr:S8 family peptidase [Archangium primigenium]MBM7112342.1 S8 family peptidase [Archangium primigenium]